MTNQDHGHDHGHHHPATERGLWLALALNGGFLGVEVVGGLLTHSLALLSDAAHMAGDVTALVIALIAHRLSQQPATGDRTFGMRRAEVLGAFVNALGLMLIAFGILVEAGHRLVAGAPDVPAMPVLVIGIVGLAINLGSAFVLMRAAEHDMNARGALAHMLADALGSVGAIAAAGAIWLGYPIADTLVSVLLAAAVGWGASRLAKTAGAVLLQAPPPGIRPDALRAALLAVDDVEHVHDLHVWSLDGRSPIVTAHLVMVDDADPAAVDLAARQLAKGDFNAVHTTFQLERPDTLCNNRLVTVTHGH